MSSKALDLVSEKPDCQPVSGVTYRVSDSVIKVYDAMVGQPTAAAKTMLDGFSIDTDSATNATLSTLAGASLFAIGGAGTKATEMTIGKGAAFVFDGVARAIMPGTEMNGLVRATLDEPYAPRVMRAGLKTGAYGAAVGLTAYGLYKSYEYLTAAKE